MISKRYKYSKSSSSLYPMTSDRSSGLSQFVEKLDQQIYNTEKTLCPCSAKSDIILASRDRFNIPMTTVICKNCGIIRTNPRLTDDSYRNFYKNEYRDIESNPTFYSPEHKKQVLFTKEYNGGKRVYDFLKSKLQKSQSNKILDIGCGYGGMLKYFSELGYQTLGCDYDTEAVAYGNSQNLKIIQGGVEIIPSDQTFDLVILSHLLEHTTDPNTFLKSLSKLMHQGSLLYIELPSVFGVSIKRYRNDFLRYLRIFHTYSFTLNTLSDLLAYHGFEKISGTEFIQATFQFTGSTKSTFPADAKNFESIMKHLSMAEHIRLFTLPLSLYYDFKKPVLVKSYNKLNQSSLTKPIIKLAKQLNNLNDKN